MPNNPTDLPHLFDRLAAEGLQPLADAVTEAGVRRRAPFSLIRWVVAGVDDGHGGRLRLEATKATGRWETSVAAVRRFLRARDSIQRGARAIDRDAQRRLAKAALASRGLPSKA